MTISRMPSPSFIASMLLTIRFIATCCNCTWSPMIGGRSVASSVRTDMSYCRFCTLLIVYVGSRTDESQDFSFGIMQDHRLLQMPAIRTVLGTERPGFHREIPSPAHAFPKIPDCCLPIFGVDRGHPRFG